MTSQSPSPDERKSYPLLNGGENLAALLASSPPATASHRRGGGVGTVSILRSSMQPVVQPVTPRGLVVMLALLLGGGGRCIGECLVSGVFCSQCPPMVPIVPCRLSAQPALAQLTHHTTTTATTENGCRCRSSWSVTAGTCPGNGGATYSGCGMNPPCDGDEATSRGFPSWCYVEPGCSGGRGSDRNWDYCNPSINLDNPSDAGG